MARLASTQAKTTSGVGLDLRAALISTGLIVGFTVLTALSSLVRLPLPFTPVPITMQVMVVLLAGALLGTTRGSVSQGLYVLWGAGGLPLFTGGAVGLAALMGPTGGYLIGFIPAAMLAGHMVKRSQNYFHVWMSLFFASLIILALGWLHLTLFLAFSPSTAFMLGVAPFLPGDIVKVSLAAGIVMGVRRLQK